MTFADQLEGLEVEAYRRLDSIPRDELRRHMAVRSGNEGQADTEASAAIGAVIDFREYRRSAALKWAQGFALRFLSQIRSQICNSTVELEQEAGITPATAASAVAAWIAGILGVTNPVAFAMATLIVLVLARALEKSFCTMSEDELKLDVNSSKK
jgi:hypothetical protein